MSSQSPFPRLVFVEFINCSVCSIIRYLPFLPSDTHHAHRQLPIQRILLFFRRLHAQCVFYLGRGPESDACPGHETDTEQGPGFGGEAAVGAVRLVSFLTFFLASVVRVLVCAGVGRFRAVSRTSRETFGLGMRLF